MTDWVSGVRLASVLLALLSLPGWAMLAIAGSWRSWAPLQRWCLAVGLSVAFYPVLFYGWRSVFPTGTLGPYKLTALLVVCGGVAAWRLRRHWRELVAFDRLEWLALAIFGATLFTRFWIVHLHPYPAATDSLHHTLLTQLTAALGRLPLDLEPYAPIPLGQYHLGLYALTGSVESLAQVPAHSALLWTAQALNGLCGVGVYLVLDRKVGRLGGVVGALVVGLVSHQPAWYVNWGRFTQVAGQAVLLIAWLMTWEAIRAWRGNGPVCKRAVVWNSLLAAMLTAAVFLLHFRVAAFYLPLLAISVTWEVIQAWRQRQLGSVMAGIVTIGAASLLMVSPALWQALETYVSNAQRTLPVSAEDMALAQQTFFGVPFEVVPTLAAHWWLMGLAAVGLGLGVWRRNKLTVGVVMWVVTLMVIGNANLLRLPLIAVVNLSAVLIMLYLPIGLIIGTAAQEACNLASALWRPRLLNIVTVLVMGAVVVFGFLRTRDVEPDRYFVTPADAAAMDWIRSNTPTNARFAVNTMFWLPTFPGGTDAGYWIPYFTGRQTTAANMLLGLAPQAYIMDTLARSKDVVRLATDPAALKDLSAAGVDYIYIGAIGNLGGSGLEAERLNQSGQAVIVYQRDGVTVLRLTAAAPR